MDRKSISRRYWLAASAGFAAFAAFLPAAAIGQGTDTPAARIETLHAVLLDAMKQGRQLGAKGRYDKLAPVLLKTYDAPLMARIAVGQNWDALNPGQQAAVVDAFSRMMVATYASRFDDFSGERFEIVQTLDQPPADKFVKTRITQSNGKIVSLNYLMRRSGSDWRVVDVYLDGTISELASRRAEFGTILKSGGPDALISSLRQQGDKLLTGS
jgi:phospholipid transport system substrate-binding protein